MTTREHERRLIASRMCASTMFADARWSWRQHRSSSSSDLFSAVSHDDELDKIPAQTHGPTTFDRAQHPKVWECAPRRASAFSSLASSERSSESLPAPARLVLRASGCFRNSPARCHAPVKGFCRHLTRPGPRRLNQRRSTSSKPEGSFASLNTSQSSVLSAGQLTRFDITAYRPLARGRFHRRCGPGKIPG